MQEATRLVEGAWGWVFTLVRSKVRNHQDALELTQEVLLRAWTHFASLRNREKFRQWIRRITRNEIVTWIRRREIERAALRVFHPPESSSTVDMCLQTEQRSRVQDALNRLGEKHRAVLVAFHYDGLSYEEISRKLQTPIGTVRSRIVKARKRLRVELERAA